MTRIKVPKDERVSYPDADVRRSSPASRRLTGALRGMKDDLDRTTEARVQPKIAKILGREPEDEVDAATEASLARREADVARATADAASARYEADAAATRLAEAEAA